MQFVLKTFSCDYFQIHVEPVVVVWASYDNLAV